MPKSFTHTKRKTAPNGPGPGRPRAAPKDEMQEPPLRLSHAQLAQLLWSETYDVLIREEAAGQPELLKIVQEAVQQQKSTYERRGCGGIVAKQRQKELVEEAARGMAAQVRRLGNMRDIPLVVAARSLSWLMAMARTKQWREERRMRRL